MLSCVARLNGVQVMGKKPKEAFTAYKYVQVPGLIISLVLC